MGLPRTVVIGQENASLQNERQSWDSRIESDSVTKAESIDRQRQRAIEREREGETRPKVAETRESPRRPSRDRR